MADIEQMKKIVPLITCEIPFGQHVCELMFGVNVTDLNFWGSNNHVKQPVQSKSVGSGNVSHCGTLPFDNHVDYSLIVLQDIQHSTGTRIRCISRNVINVCWNDVGVLDWDGVMHVWLGSLQRVSPELFLRLFNLVRYGMKYFNHQVPESESGNIVHAQTCIDRNVFSFCRSV